MHRRDSRWRAGGVISGLLLAAISGSLGCWEQVSMDWFPQMKRQIAIQPFELNTLVGNGQGLLPPDGTVPVGNPHVDLAGLGMIGQEYLANPVPMSLASLKNGEVLYKRYCLVCHGPQGRGDGPLAGAPFGSGGPLGSGGPFGMVLPIAGPMGIARALSDGHIYTTISLGRVRMPGYQRIPPPERWDLVNYVRDMIAHGGRQ